MRRHEAAGVHDHRRQARAALPSSICEPQNLAIDYQGRRGPYDLVLTCSDVFLQKNIRGDRIVLVQEGITDPEDRNFRLVQRHRWLPLWIAGTAATGLSDAYRAFCVASEGYRDFFIAQGREGGEDRRHRHPQLRQLRSAIATTRSPTGTTCWSARRRCGRSSAARTAAFIREAVAIADGRPMIFKFHPNEDIGARPRRKCVSTPRAPWYSGTGSAEEMIANCDVLITRYSSTVFVGLALGKETYSDLPDGRVAAAVAGAEQRRGGEHRERVPAGDRRSDAAMSRSHRHGSSERPDHGQGGDDRGGTGGASSGSRGRSTRATRTGSRPSSRRSACCWAGGSTRFSTTRRW